MLAALWLYRKCVFVATGCAFTREAMTVNYIEELRKQGWKEDPKPNRSSKLEAEKLLLDYRKMSKKA